MNENQKYNEDMKKKEKEINNYLQILEKKGIYLII